jgi:hypothetical protein
LKAIRSRKTSVFSAAPRVPGRRTRCYASRLPRWADVAPYWRYGLLVAAHPGQHPQFMRVLHRQAVQQHFRATVKMAVFAPIPSASEMTAMIASEGLRRSWRAAKRRSRPRLASDITDRSSLALLQQSDIAKLTARGGAASSWAHASANTLLREELQVHPHLLVGIESAFRRPNSPLSFAAKTRNREPSLSLPFLAQYTADDARNTLPVFRLNCQLLQPTLGDGVEPGLAVVFGGSPLRTIHPCC